MNFLRLFYEAIDKLSTPDPAYIPDYRERSLTSIKIKVQLFLFPTLLIFTGIQMLRSDNITFSLYYRTFHLLCILVSLLICCRSYLKTYYVILTILMSSLPVILTIQGDLEAPMATGFLSIHILSVITDTWKSYIFASIVQLLNFHFFLRQSLEMSVIRLGPQEFSRQFVLSATRQVVFMLFTIYPMQKAMKESKVEAENSLSHYKTFLFSFSHEIRNPINILLGSLELALQERLPSSALQVIQTAKISGELLLQLINNVLDVGKAEVEKLEIVPTPTRVHDLLIRMWNISSELIKKKKLVGYLKISMDLPCTLELDPDRLNQVLLNLLSNAVKFTPSGLINLTIEWLSEQEKVSDECFEPLPFNQEEEGIFDKNECISTLGYSTGSKPGRLNNFYTLTHLQKTIHEDMHRSNLARQREKISKQPNGLLKIVVKDQGCGMSQEGMKGLFKKFYQCNSEASQRKRGTGLGLYITKDICKSMGGEIRVYSEENKGTVFIVCIPCRSISTRF